jgi:hypothetical protein
MMNFLKGSWRWLQGNYPTWNTVHELGTSKMVASSFIWLVLIPVIARGFTAAEQKYQLQVYIPINFLLLYLAALFFAFASGLFYLFCPEIIKRAPHFGSFIEGGYTALDLKKWFHTLSKRYDQKINAHILCHFLDHVGKGNLTTKQDEERDSGIAGPHLLDAFWNLPLDPDNLPSIYDMVRNTANKETPIIRSMVFLLYTAGFVAFAYIAYLNLQVMVRYVSEHSVSI